MANKKEKGSKNAGLSTFVKSSDKQVEDDLQHSNRARKIGVFSLYARTILSKM